jgi:AraC-like DNA-binding protein
VRTGAPGTVLTLFENLISSARRGTSLSAKISALVLEQLILTTAENWVPCDPADTQAFATYKRCRSHIEDHWPRLVSLAQVAHECGIDPAYFCSLFRRFDRQSPYQYLLARRIRGAAERLLEPATSIKMVASELGFSDAFHFSRVFKRLMGMPPGHFARVHRRS